MSRNPFFHLKKAKRSCWTFISRALEKSGFSVHLAPDGLEAIQMFGTNPDGYRAVLLDLTMPHMDGEETFREIRRICASHSRAS